MKIFTFVLCCLLCCSCTDVPVTVEKTSSNSKLPQTNKTNLFANWQLADLSFTNNKVIGADKLLATAKIKKAIEDGLLYSFFENGSATAIDGLGNYANGKWKYLNKKNKMEINFDGEKDTLNIYFSTINNNEFLQLTKASTGQKMLFSTLSTINKDEFLEDPFYQTNNQWRMVPPKKQTNAELKSKLTNYIQHLAYLLKSANDKKLQAVTFKFSQGIIKIYDGGIGIVPKDEVPKSWIYTFYNADQAFTTYTMFENYLKNSSNYKGASTGNWLLDDYNILISIYGHIVEADVETLIKPSK